MSDGGSQSGNQYRLVTHGESCDICETAAGEYPERPDVPLHRGCDCTVSGPEQGGPNCEIEIRNLRQSYSEAGYSRDFEVDFCQPGDLIIDISAEIDALFESAESFDEGVEDAAEQNGWVKPPLPLITINLDENSHNLVQVDVKIASWMFLGEKWEICSTEDPVAGTRVTETHVGSAGGGWTGPMTAEASVTQTDCEDRSSAPRQEPQGDGAPPDDSVDVA